MNGYKLTFKMVGHQGCGKTKSAIAFAKTQEALGRKVLIKDELPFKGFDNISAVEVWVK